MALSIVKTKADPVAYTPSGAEISIDPVGKAPARLTVKEKRIWNRVMKEGGRNLTRSDREVFAQYCATAARVDELKALVVVEGHTQTNEKGVTVRTPASAALSIETSNALRFLTALNLTPTSRVRAPNIK